MDLHIKGKTAVITGGSKGIGYAIAEQFLAEGTKIALIARNRWELELAAKKLSGKEASYAERILCIPADMSRKTEVFSVAEQVYDRFGSIDIWINNVGATGSRKKMDYEETEIDFVVNTCFKSAVYGCQAAYHYLKKQGGAIVNIASLAARCPSAGRSTLYGPMKAAIVNLTQTMAGEFCADGIRVNCIMPGFTLTPLVQAAISEEELDYNRRGTLLHRLAVPEDIAKPAVFLSSDAAAYMTGTTIEVSGGRSVTLNPDYAWNRKQELT